MLNQPDKKNSFTESSMEAGILLGGNDVLNHMIITQHIMNHNTRLAWRMCRGRSWNSEITQL